MYIRKVMIENFQSHDKTTLEFDKGLNVIVGPSDQGKTAVIRAIKWVLFNEPRGTEFIRNGAAFARVVVELSSGDAIQREKGKGKNRYILTKSDGEESVFEGFGNEVPYEIFAAHGMESSGIDPDINIRMNIAEQLEGPFLLSQSGAVRAKALGRLTGTHILDRAVKNCLADLRRDQQTFERVKGEVDAVQAEMEQYQDIELLEMRVKQMDEGIKYIENLQIRAEKVENLSERLQALNDEQKKNNEILHKYSGLEDRLWMINSCQQKLLLLQLLNKNRKDLVNIEGEIEKDRQILIRTDEVKLAEKHLDKFDKRIRTLGDIQRAQEKYIKVIEDIKAQQTLLNKLTHESNIMIESYADMLQKAGRCPLCYSVISGNKVSEIIESL